MKEIKTLLPEELVAVVEALEVEELPQQLHGGLGAVRLDLRGAFPSKSKNKPPSAFSDRENAFE